MGYQQVKNLVDHALGRVKEVRKHTDEASDTVTLQLVSLLAAGLEYNAQAVDRLNAEILYPRTKDDEGQNEYVERVRKFLRLPPLAAEVATPAFPQPHPGEFRAEYADRVRKFLGLSPLDGATAAQPDICGVISNSGRAGEPLACGKAVGHQGPHAWATLPTFDDEGYSDSDRMARHQGEEIARLTAEAKRMQREVERLQREAGEMNVRCGQMQDFFNLFRKIADAEDNAELAKTVPGPYTPS